MTHGHYPDDGDFPVDYCSTIVTLDEPIHIVNELGGQQMSVVRCVEVSEGDEFYELHQPLIDNRRDNDVVVVRKDNVRGILYMGEKEEP